MPSLVVGGQETPNVVHPDYGLLHHGAARAA